MLPHQRAVISWSLAGVHSLPATNCLQNLRTFSFHL
ncbi:rCG37890 [Rattus norvegicus]|uniref:RCG37890 n=1 Tax=Rattus norvegicus TaxID=10116 RepID=A6K663_RAT|nr:rCG37890 [Rattus norvegicus]